MQPTATRQRGAGSHRLTPAQIESLKREYVSAPPRPKVKELAEKYGVSERTVYNIVRPKLAKEGAAA